MCGYSRRLGGTRKRGRPVIVIGMREQHEAEQAGQADAHRDVVAAVVAADGVGRDGAADQQQHAEALDRKGAPGAPPRALAEGPERGRLGLPMTLAAPEPDDHEQVADEDPGEDGDLDAHLARSLVIVGGEQENLADGPRQLARPEPVRGAVDAVGRRRVGGLLGLLATRAAAGVPVAERDLGVPEGLEREQHAVGVELLHGDGEAHRERALVRVAERGPREARLEVALQERGELAGLWVSSASR